MSDKNFMSYGDAEPLFAELGSELEKRVEQYSTMPSASSTLLNKIVQYIGTTSESYINGLFYKCVYNEDEADYEWVKIDMGGGNGIAITATLLASGWNANNQQTIIFDGYSSNMNGVIGVPASATSAQKTAYTEAIINVVSQSGNSFTFEATNVPSIDLPVVVYAGGGSGSGGGGGEDVGFSIVDGAITSTYDDDGTEVTEDIMQDETGDEIATVLDSIAETIQLLGQPEVYAPVVYSLEEREIGVWTDGKPLYQKTIDFGALPNATTKSVAHGISNPDYIAFVSAVGKNSSNAFAPIPMTNTLAPNEQVQIYFDTTNINIRTAVDYSAWSVCKVTIQYTKTTDVPGSGNYAALGVPAVHYDDTERVIGTWFGETLYQKTIDCGALPDSTSKNLTTPNNIKYVVSATGFCVHDNDIANQRPLPFVGGGTNDIRVDMNNGSLRILTFADWSSYNGYLIVQYTKTS